MAGLRMRSLIAHETRRIEAEDEVQFGDIWAALAAVVSNLTELTDQVVRLRSDVNRLIGDGREEAHQGSEGRDAEEARQGAVEEDEGREGAKPEASADEVKLTFVAAALDGSWHVMRGDEVLKRCETYAEAWGWLEQHDEAEAMRTRETKVR
jgi:hypothetical protein